MLQLSPDLEKLLSELPDMEKDLFVEAVSRPLPECVRVNSLKLKEELILGSLKERGWVLEKLPWARYGYRVLESSASSVGASIEHMAGLLYIQGPLSMLPVEVMEVKRGDVVLDLCAAPGSKSTQLAQHMENRGVLVCNDVAADRIKPLVSNLQRFGVMNHVVTQADGTKFYKWGRRLFDKVLVDVPCSSLGIISKDMSNAKKYSERISLRIGRLQRALLASAFDCLKEGGILIYSTCTIHPLENEGVVSWLLDKREDAKIIPFEVEGLRRRKPLEEWRGRSFRPEVKSCFKAYPYDNWAEGFFVAKLVKGG